MLATKILLSGLAIAILGGIVLALVHLGHLSVGLMPVSFLIIGLGVVVFGVGFYMLSRGLRPEEGVHAHDAGAAFQALARCMTAMAIADGKLDDEELVSICRIFEKLTGNKLDEGFVREIVAQMQRDGVTMSDELAVVKPILTDDLKLKLIRAAFLILAADGVADEKEERLMEEIRAGLGFPKPRFNAMKKKFFESRGGLKQGA